MRLIGRVLAMVLGLLGSLVALVTIVLYAPIHRAATFFGDRALDTTHGLSGLLLVLVGVMASILALFAPRLAGFLLLAVGVALFFVVKGYAALSILFFLLAAVLAFADRSAGRRERPRP